MKLRMKNFNIFGVHWKIRFLGWRVPKNQYREGDCFKMGSMDSLQIWDGGGGLTRKAGVVLLKEEGGGGWHHNARYDGNI